MEGRSRCTTRAGDSGDDANAERGMVCPDRPASNPSREATLRKCACAIFEFDFIFLKENGIFFS